MSLLDKIKQDAQKSGGSKQKFFYVKDGDKRRVRFLQDMDDGMEVTFHDSYEANINIPCRQLFGKDCPYCEEEGLRTRIQYAWSVWDYDSNEVRILMYPMNNCTPIGQIAAMYETYGTLLDRDFVIQRVGKQQNTTYTVIPMDKNKFRNEKAKPFSKKAFLEKLDEAFPDEHANLYEKDEPKKMKKKSKSTKEDDDDEKELPWGGVDVIDYDGMSAKELYKLCEEREIEAEPKNPKSYYIELLKDYDEENSRSNDDSDDEWDEDENEGEDYSSMSAKELYKLCKERNIEALPKKNEKYYINLLEEDDKAHDEWEDDEEADDDDEDDEWE